MSAMHGITNFKSNYVFIIARACGTDHKLVESWHGQLLSAAFFAGLAVHDAEKCGWLDWQGQCSRVEVSHLACELETPHPEATHDVGDRE